MLISQRPPFAMVLISLFSGFLLFAPLGYYTASWAQQSTAAVSSLHPVSSGALEPVADGTRGRPSRIAVYYQLYAINNW